MLDKFRKVGTALSNPTKILQYLHWRIRNYRWKRVSANDDLQCDLDQFDIELNIQNGPVSRSLYFDGIYEPDETAVYKHLIQEGMVVGDVGANIGYFSILFSDMVGDGLVYSFEPEETNFEVLNKNISLNGVENIRAENKALSSGEDKINLYKHPTNPGGHSIHKDGVLPFEQFPDEGEVSSVDSSTFDKYFSSQDRTTPDFVKIDVEGGEPNVLYGMKDTLNSTPILSIEYAPQLWTEDPDDVFNYLLSYGYQLFEIRSGGDIVPVSKETILNYNDGWYSILVATDDSISHIQP